MVKTRSFYRQTNKIIKKQKLEESASSSATLTSAEIAGHGCDLPSASGDLFSIPKEIWYRHLSRYLSRLELTFFMVGVLKLKLDEVDLKKCNGGKNWDVEKEWTNAIMNNNPNVIISITLYCPERNPSRTGFVGLNYTLSWASANGHLEVLRLLLADQRVNPAAGENEAIRSLNGHLEIARLLLLDQRVNPAAVDNEAVRNASAKGHLEVVCQLVSDQRVNPAAKDNAAIKSASRNGHLEVVRLLLSDQRVNPAADDNQAIRLTSEYGRLEVVRLLLTDQRVDPSANRNYAIKWAARNNHTQVVQLLLSHLLIKTGIYSYSLQNLAIKEKNNGHSLLYDLMEKAPTIVLQE
jgi:ankyrin repeat protein